MIWTDFAPNRVKYYCQIIALKMNKWKLGVMILCQTFLEATFGAWTPHKIRRVQTFECFCVMKYMI